MRGLEGANAARFRALACETDARELASAVRLTPVRTAAMIAVRLLRTLTAAAWRSSALALATGALRIRIATLLILLIALSA